MNDQEHRGLICYFADGTSLSFGFPKQSDNEAVAMLKLEKVLDSRCLLFEVEGRLCIVPFENLKYVQVYPAPESVRGHTYIKGASTS